MVATFPTTGCGRGWVGVRKGRCQRAKPDRPQHGIGKTIAHQGAHLAENVAAWKTGKVVGGAITALAASKGYDGDSVRLMAETAVQATAATLLSMRDKSKRTPEAIATKFVAESMAAMAGKLAHGGFEDAAESFGKSEHFASMGALLSGKGAGITTNVAAMRSGLAATVAKAVLRKRVDSLDVDDFGLSSDQVLDLLVGAMVMLMREGLREDAKKGGTFINKGLGTKCGRGWVGIRGNCRRSTSRKSGKGGLTKAQKAKAQEMAGQIRAGKEMVNRTKKDRQVDVEPKFSKTGTIQPKRKGLIVTVHNKSQVAEFEHLVKLGAARKIKWTAPDGSTASAEFQNTPQGFVYQAGAYSIPAEKFIKQMKESGLPLTFADPFSSDSVRYL